MTYIIKTRDWPATFMKPDGGFTLRIDEAAKFGSREYAETIIESRIDKNRLEMMEQMPETLKLPATAQTIQEFANAFFGSTTIECVDGELRKQRKIKGHRIAKAAQYGVTEEYFDQSGEWTRQADDAAIFQTHRMAEIVRDAIKPGGNYAIETVYHD